MKKNHALKFAYSFIALTVASLAHANSPVKSIKYIQDHVRYGKRVMVQGTVSQKLAHNYFILDDKSKKIILNTSDLKPALNVDEEYVIVGLYLDSEVHRFYDEEINVFDIVAPGQTEEIERLAEKYDISYAENKRSLFGLGNKKVVGESEVANDLPVEQRLQKLKNLREKDLITEEEYKSHKSRILQEL